LIQPETRAKIIFAVAMLFVDVSSKRIAGDVKAKRIMK